MFELTDMYASKCREYERLYLSAALRFPVKAIDVAVKHELTERSFAYGEHRLIFKWVCDAAQRGHTFTLESFRELNRTGGHPLHPVNVNVFWWTEIVPTGLDSWARRIKDLETTRSRIDRLNQLAARMLERCAA